MSDQETEKRIFEAATAVFHEQGYHGARMQEIARRAGINQSMLHYYFRSKDRLFEEVFRLTARQVIAPVMQIFRSDLPLREKVGTFVEAYITRVVENPHVPGFILEELRRNPRGLREFVGEQTSGVFERMKVEIRDAVAEGDIAPTDPAQLIVNLLSLCIFPFVARPMLQTLTGMTDPEYTDFVETRKKEVVRFIFNALSP